MIELGRQPRASRTQATTWQRSWQAREHGSSWFYLIAYGAKAWPEDYRAAWSVCETLENHRVGDGRHK